MCGISGIWGERDERAVRSMVDALEHRGPDDRGHEIKDRFSIGMARLSILDTSSAGHQPMVSRCGEIWIVYNGETYNFAEERAALEAKGHRFDSGSDTEVVLRLYEVYGDDFLLRLQGIFALAIVDMRRGPGRERLLLARDPMGVKPLLFGRTSKGLVFASELRALMASSRIRPELDGESLRLLLTFGSVSQPRTLIQGVEMLPPAHRLIAENGDLRIERYWSLAPDRRPELRVASAGERVELIEQLLEDAVRAQMVSDVPIGAFLSGGLDSSILVALMARIAGSRVRTFSVGFESGQTDTHDETDAAAETAAFLGTDHTRVVVTGEDVRAEIAQIVARLDQPSVDGTNSWFVSQAAAPHVSVAISGTGGDELFAGYPWFHNLLAETAGRSGLGESLGGRISSSRLFDPLVAGRYGERVTSWRQRSGFLGRYAAQFHIFGSLGSARILAGEHGLGAGRAMAADIRAQDELAGQGTIARTTALCLRGYTCNQLLRDIDAASMAHSLEVRVPYLDTRIVDAALSLPDEAKIAPSAGPGSAYRDGRGKRILVEVGRRLLPPDFDRRPKRGFEMPNGAWLRGPLRDVFEDALAPARVKDRGCFQPAEVAAVRRGFEEGRLSWPQPWLLMVLELWLRQLVDAPRGGAPTQARDALG